MLQLLMKTSMMLGTIFLMANHPLTMGLILFLQTILICFITGNLSTNFWFSYILILIFLGGMLVLFMYVTSLAPNEMFLYSNKLMLSSILLMLLILMTMCLKPKSHFVDTISNHLCMNFNSNSSLLKLYNQPTNNLTIMLAAYLLLALIAIIKIICIHKGPLRFTSYEQTFTKNSSTN
nr:NADH dehydrogenase subunit 6 [Metallyticus sp. JZ-2017]